VGGTPVFSFSDREQAALLVLLSLLLLGTGVLGWKHARGTGATPAGIPRPRHPTFLTVHVAGAVKRPGIYRLQPGSRVVEAVEAAGGGIPGASLQSLNLAEVIQDGERIYVPSADEMESGAARNRVPGKPALVNINLADRAALETLPGIGPALAERIIRYRLENGLFRRKEDLLRVPGIGPGKFEGLKDLITVQP